MPTETGNSKHVPSSNHPWRKYANRLKTSSTEEDKPPRQIHRKLKIVLSEIIENWDTIEIEVYNTGGAGRRYLSEISDDKIAGFIIGLLSPYRRVGGQFSEDGD